MISASGRPFTRIWERNGSAGTAGLIYTIKTVGSLGLLVEAVPLAVQADAPDVEMPNPYSNRIYPGFNNYFYEKWESGLFGVSC